jgi:hypothetical protein
MMPNDYAKCPNRFVINKQMVRNTYVCKGNCIDLFVYRSIDAWRSIYYQSNNNNNNNKIEAALVEFRRFIHDLFFFNFF